MSQVAVQQPQGPKATQGSFSQKQKPLDVRLSNIHAAKSLADVVRTSLGPKGMDKMIQTAQGATIVTNDGATILKHLNVLHPCAKMLVELSEAQDVAAGDGTTSVVVMAGAFLDAAEKLLAKGLHPSIVSEALREAGRMAGQFVERISTPVSLEDRPALIKAASTSLNSKVVAQYSVQIATLAVEAVLQVRDMYGAVDLKDIRVMGRVGGTVDDLKIVPNNGILLNQLSMKTADSPTRIEKAKIAIIQFQLSPPKTDMENQIVVTDYQQMDRILREERAYLLNLIKRIKKTGCNVLLVQKSILRDAVSEMALHYLAKSKIMAVQNIERDEVEWLSKSLGCRAIADIECFTEDKLVSAELVEEREDAGAKYLVIEGVSAASAKKTCSMVVRGANQVTLEEAERSLHDCLCAVRCLVRVPATISGGGAGEIEAAVKLAEYGRTLAGPQGYCIAVFAEALEAIPTILAENAGLPPVPIVTELRSIHATSTAGGNYGINVRRGCISNMLEEGIVQPLLVTTSCLQLSTETVSMILKIDDIVQSR